MQSPDTQTAKYKYVFSKFCKRMTVVCIILLIAVFLYLFFSSTGTYLSAWFLSFSVAIVGLLVMSVPRYIKLTPAEIEIHCVLELTTIPLLNIKRITRVSQKNLKYAVPVLGSYGFGGYFGYYFDFRKFLILRMYATQWDRFVMIHDIFGRRYVISAQDPEAFIADVMQRIKAISRKEISLDMNDAEAEAQDTDE